MAHSLGGLSDLPHGKCNAILLESVINFNFEACPKGGIIAQAMNADCSSQHPSDKKKT